MENEKALDEATGMAILSGPRLTAKPRRRKWAT